MRIIVGPVTVGKTYKGKQWDIGRNMAGAAHDDHILLKFLGGVSVFLW
jgi:hypothetical protein